MRDVKFQYIYELLGVVCRPTLTLEQIEGGLAAKDSFPSNAKIIAKRQYTGLKDCNGVEIYEGDIIKSLCGAVVEVIWLDASFAVVIAKYHRIKIHQPYLNDNGFKVIGNIHENPELLESAKC